MTAEFKLLIKSIIEKASIHPSADQLEKKFSFDRVNYDQEHGIGNVPNNSNIHYMGFTVISTPSDFLQLTPKRPWDEDNDYVLDAIRSGSPIATPFLSCDISSGITEVAGHEGRGRCMALSKLYGRDVPVILQIFIRGLRARNITTDMIRNMYKVIEVQNIGVRLPGPHFGPVVCLRKQWIDIIDEVDS